MPLIAKGCLIYMLTELNSLLAVTPLKRFRGQVSLGERTTIANLDALYDLVKKGLVPVVLLGVLAGAEDEQSKTFGDFPPT